jgi:hypothetical protein
VFILKSFIITLLLKETVPFPLAFPPSAALRRTRTRAAGGNVDRISALDPGISLERTPLLAGNGLA